MPLDNTTPHTTALAIDLDVPSLPALAYALRHPETWPDSFVWNYAQCESCAAGLIHELWNEGRHGTFTTAAKIVNLPRNSEGFLFLGVGLEFDTMMQDVTPEMVADVIDALMARAT